ncbi:MAG TPA: sigma-70 family RNA polymerase sigma factor [Saprospiraceae bacterium]|nr:sigma-70 family RNA polymerase sigma factor [Saprospiraceae bacterium]
MKLDTNTSDEILVEECLGNNRRAQEALYKKYFDSMFAMCLKYTSNRDVALDIVNRGMLRVFKKIEKFSHKGSLEGWIRKIVFHALSEFFKKDNRYREHVLLNYRDERLENRVLDNLYYEDLIDLIRYLPNSSLKVFKLYVLEGYSHNEIADKIGISEGTSKWHLSNARKKLIELIEKQYDSNVG